MTESTTTDQEWECRTLVAVEDASGRHAEIDGRRVPGVPEQVLADLWEQGWQQDAIWYVDVANGEETRQVFHEARLRRRRQDQTA